MNTEKGLVLDANILIRAVFGKKVRRILETYEDDVLFYSPDVCFQEARSYVPAIAERRRQNLDSAFSTLDDVSLLVHPMDHDSYRVVKTNALERIASRDPDDWPVVATALLLNVPIWTEDQDFFGTGIPTWTTDRVEIYLKS